jgi:hypothetical protein
MLRNLFPGVQIEYDKDDSSWRINRQRFFEVARELAHHYGKAGVAAQFKATQKCDTRCREASGEECVCSCGYQYHGLENFGFMDGWILVGETTLVKYSEDIIEKRWIVTRREHADTCFCPECELAVDQRFQCEYGYVI